MGTYQQALEFMAQLEAHDIRAVADPRSAHAPCVLLVPPTRTYDLPLPSYSVTWQFICLAPGPGNADAWVCMDDLVDRVLEALDLADVTVTPGSYQLTGDGHPHPAYTITHTEGT